MTNQSRKILKNALKDITSKLSYSEVHPDSDPNLHEKNLLDLRQHKAALEYDLDIVIEKKG